MWCGPTHVVAWRFAAARDARTLKIVQRHFDSASIAKMLANLKICKRRDAFSPSALPGNLTAGKLRATGTAGAVDSAAAGDPKAVAETNERGPVFMRMVAHNPDFSCLGVSATDRTGEPGESKRNA